VAFDVASIVRIEVDAVGVEGEGGEAEQKGTGRGKGMCKVTFVRSCRQSVGGG